MSALTDAQRLVDFVAWEMRSGDLPTDVRDAALRLRPARPPHLEGQVIGVTEGPLRVAGYYAGDDDRDRQRRCFPHQVGRVVQGMLDDGCTYVLVQDI